jgi:hypothetical protein
MANRTVSIFVRFTKQGKRNTVPATYIGNARLRPHPGWVYWIRWYAGTRQRWKWIGSDPVDALKAQMRQEATLSGERMPAEESSPVSRATLAESIESFLLERSTQTDERGVARWRWELDLSPKSAARPT